MFYSVRAEKYLGASDRLRPSCWAVRDYSTDRGDMLATAVALNAREVCVTRESGPNGARRVVIARWHNGKRVTP